MTLEVPLTIGRNRTDSGLVALIDDEDLERVATERWRVFLTGWKKVYAASGKGTLLHRFLLNAPKGSEVDHINGDGLDNRRCNIRYGTHSQNLANQGPHLMRAGKPTQSEFKGVTYMEGRTRPWRATISVNRQQHFLGYHPNEVGAAKAYDAAARLYFGAFARTNFGVEE